MPERQSMSLALHHLSVVLEEFARCGAEGMDGEAQQVVVDALRFCESHGIEVESAPVLLGEQPYNGPVVGGDGWGYPGDGPY